MRIELGRLRCLGALGTDEAEEVSEKARPLVEVRA